MRPWRNRGVLCIDVGLHVLFFTTALTVFWRS